MNIINIKTKNILLGLIKNYIKNKRFNKKYINLSINSINNDTLQRNNIIFFDQPFVSKFNKFFFNSHIQIRKTKKLVITKKSKATILILMILLITAYNSFYIIEPEEYGVVVRFGVIIKVIDKPKLYFKLPFITDVKKFDNRKQIINSDPKKYYFGNNNQDHVIIEYFALYKIIDIEAYYKISSYNTHDINVVKVRLVWFINDLIRKLIKAISSEEGTASNIQKSIDNNIEELKKTIISELGIDLINVKIRTIVYP